jgi:hypothetical protein
MVNALNDRLGKARPYEAAQLQEIINYDVTGEHVYGLFSQIRPPH